MVRPCCCCCNNVYGNPLANRNVTNAPRFRKMLPNSEPLCQSLGNWSCIEPAMLCVRLSSVGRMACGGGEALPVRLETSRPSNVTYVYGFDPVLRAICNVYAIDPLKRFENRRS